MKDFTITIYRKLLQAFIDEGYEFQTFRQYLKDPADRVIILRHDVDSRNHRSLKFARIQNNLGIVGSYYFRVVPKSYDERIIKAIHRMGHEIGYHYEDMDFASGDPDQAIELFERHLNKLQDLVPIDTICMHGSPLSKYDNRNVWKYYDYEDYGIIGEPYFDIDFSDVFYLTDTGRSWDGQQFIVRDKVEVANPKTFHSTQDIIKEVKMGEFPDKAMLNFHPERWMNHRLLWLREKYLQKMKNVAKYMLMKVR